MLNRTSKEGTTSFWIQHNRPHIEFDCVVVGAGVIGCSAAYWLHRLHPELKVCVVEAGHVASGASGRNAGFILQGTATAYKHDVDKFGRDTARRLYDLTLENRNLIFSELPESIIGSKACGSVTAAGSEDEALALEESEELLLADGFEARYLDADAIQLEIASEGFLGGLYIPTGGVVDPVKLVRHLLEKSGATVFEYDPLRSISDGANGVFLETKHRSLSARMMLLAANAYLPRVLPDMRLGVGPLVRPVRAQMLVTNPRPEFLQKPVYSHDGYYYVRQHESGRIMVGGARHLHADVEVGYEDATTDALQRDLEEYLAQYFPASGDISVSNRWSGTMGFSPDSRPILGAVPNVRQAWWVTGFTGHGMSIAFRTGQLIARKMMHQSDEMEDLFSPERFANQDN